MPKTTKSGQPKKDELPSTLQRSPKKAQRTFAKTYDSAVDTYDGDESRAARTAYAAVKHSYEKVGDHWEPKDEKGPSDGGRGQNAGGATGVGALSQLCWTSGLGGAATSSSALSSEQADRARTAAARAASRRAFTSWSSPG